jgi:hypothetical protein
MEYTKPLGRLAGLAVIASLLGCSGGSDGPGTGTLSVSLMDAPVDTVREVNVRITGMQAKPRNGAPITLPLVTAPFTADLLRLTDQNAAILVNEAALAAGSYEWLEMDVAADFDNVPDSYVINNAGGQEELRVPSGRVRLVSGFDVPENRAVRLLFDWSVRHGLVDPPGQAGFLLKPAFRMLEVTGYGLLRGTIAPSTITAGGDPNGCTADGTDPQVGNVVYVFAGNNATVVDIDGTGPEPLATVKVELTSAGYVYRVALAPGDYTVTFTCQAALDLPESTEQIVFLPAVNRTVTLTADTIADF